MRLHLQHRFLGGQVRLYFGNSNIYSDLQHVFIDPIKSDLGKRNGTDTMSGGRYSKRKTLLHNLLGIVSIEFAIVIPLLLAMVLATVDFSWLIWSVEAVQQGASNGARCMGVLGNSCTSSGVFSVSLTTNYIQSLAATRGVNFPSGSITLSSSTTCASTSGFSKVSISYSFQTIIPNILKAFGVQPVVNVVACFPNQPS